MTFKSILKRKTAVDNCSCKRVSNVKSLLLSPGDLQCATDECTLYTNGIRYGKNVLNFDKECSSGSSWNGIKQRRRKCEERIGESP